MIRSITQWLDALAARLTDKAWLRERRRQEVHARRATHHTQLRTRRDRHFIEDELLERLERERGQQ